jgi:hypothetical protein
MDGTWINYAARDVASLKRVEPECSRMEVPSMCREHLACNQCPCPGKEFIREDSRSRQLPTKSPAKSKSSAL